MLVGYLDVFETNTFHLLLDLLAPPTDHEQTLLHEYPS